MAVHRVPQRPANHDRINRRDFLQQSAIVAGGLAASSPAQGAASQGSNDSFAKRIRHIAIDDDKKTYCGHPRQCGIRNFGNGELAVLYWRAPHGDNRGQNVSDGFDDGCLSPANVVMRRSCDRGETWPAEHDVLVWSNALPVEKRVEFLCQDPAQRQVLDMSRPEAMFFFGRTRIRLKKTVRRTRFGGWTSELAAWESGQSGRSGINMGWKTVFQLRSADKGRTWERVPLVLDPPPKTEAFWRDNHPLVVMPDGALVGAVESDGALWLYGSECQGMTWQYLSLIANVSAGAGDPRCAGLLLLPSGRLLCYMLMLQDPLGSLCVSESDDCFSWSEPCPIADDVRGPWPLRLGNGRIIIVFGRQRQPAGIAAILSDDNGKTWSEAAAIRDEAKGSRLGDPVAAELEDGRIFTAYARQLQDGDQLRKASAIEASFFELD